jgi:hypothetical protein
VNRLEPISKLSEEDNEAGELDKAEEVLSAEFPTDEYAALPLYPGEETLDEPASHIAAQPSSILRRRLDAIGAVWRDRMTGTHPMSPMTSSLSRRVPGFRVPGLTACEVDFGSSVERDLDSRNG